MHAPWVSKKCLDNIYAFAKANQPDVIIQVGDAVDFYSYSKYPRSQFVTAEQELLDARKLLEQFWGYLHKIAPKAKLHQLLGNHCIRPIKRCLELAPELEPLLKDGINKYFKFENVETHYDTREEIIIDNILFTHGHYTGLGKHMHYYRRSVVCGHTHKGGVVFENTFNGIMFELNCGYVAEPTSKIMSYTSTRFSKSTLGFGFINDGVPMFIPIKG